MPRQVLPGAAQPKEGVQHTARIATPEVQFSYFAVMPAHILVLLCLSILVGIFFVQPKMSWLTLLTRWYSKQRLGIKVQSFPVLR